MANISADAQKVLDTATPEARQWVIGQSYGGRLTSGETAKLLAQYNQKGASSMATVPSERGALGGSFQQNLSNIINSPYTFDASKFLPGIQSEAGAIYNPQRQSLEAQRELEKIKAQDAKIAEEEAFQLRMKQEEEAINRRGAFFSGGAIENEQKLRTEQARTLKSLGFQSQTVDLQLLMSIAGLNAEESKYVRDRLIGENASAYQMWANQRQFTLDGILALQNQYNSDRAFQFEQDKFEEEKKQWEKTYKLTKQKQKDDLKTSELARQKAIKDMKKSSGTNYVDKSKGWETATDDKKNVVDTNPFFRNSDGTVGGKSYAPKTTPKVLSLEPEKKNTGKMFSSMDEFMKGAKSPFASKKSNVGVIVWNG